MKEQYRREQLKRVTLYCTWRPSALTTRPHGQVVTQGSTIIFISRRYASAVCAVVVCLSVTSRYCTKTAACRIMETTPYVDAQGLFSEANNLGDIPMAPFLT